ncbi:MAG: type II toxin-antitoxin system RelE/ParE family toxin [Firmicutes bacterium]|nr:type II toxin-antitoxin system RelE/ParE family toxin [Bacillota bacterium]
MYEVKPYPDIDSALIKSLMVDIEESGDNRNYNDFIRYTTKLEEHGLDMNEKFKRQSIRKLEEHMYELRPKNFRILFTYKD